MSTRTIRCRAVDLQPGNQISSGEIVVRIVRNAIKIPRGKVWIRLKKADGSERDVEWNATTNLMVTNSEPRDDESK
jgi:hypothetical protein